MSQTSAMIKPESIDRLPFLPDEKKQYYKNGLANLWRVYESHPEGSQARGEAEAKIRNASQKFMTEYTNASKNGQGQGQGQGGGGRPLSGGGLQASSQQVGQQQGQAQARPPTQGSMSATPQQQQQQSNGQVTQQQQQPQLSQQAQNDLRSVTIHAPYGFPLPQAQKYKQNRFQRASGILRTRDAWIAKGKAAQQHLNSLNGQGQEIPANIRQALDNAKRGVGDTNGQWNHIKASNEQQGRQNVVAIQQVQQAQQGQQGQQQQQVNGAPGGSNPYQGSNGGGQVDVKVESRMSLSPQQAQGTFQQQQQLPQQAAQVQGTPGASVQQTPQTGTQSQPPSQNFQQQQQYTNQQRPPMNPQMSQQNMQHSQPPAQALSNHTQQQQQRPQALSQAAAVAQAAESYNRQPPTNNNPPLPNGLPFNAPAASALQHQHQQQQLQQNTPGSSHSSSTTVPTVPYPHPTNPQLPSSTLSTTPTQNHKFPIPKTLQVDPRLGQQAVPAPASRPTMGNSGMLQQPGLARPPTYTLEGEGDHVLSKRKLDELVRQVTGSVAGPSSASSLSVSSAAASGPGATGGGGGSSASASASASASSSASASFLAPELEESVLQLADDFVDDVITAACRLAKLRPGAQQVLEIRDVQMVLERNYGMRVPGYTLEEVRTVRKFAPAQGWQSKMGAVLSAKTLGGGGGAGAGKGE